MHLELIYHHVCKDNAELILHIILLHYCVELSLYLEPCYDFITKITLNLLNLYDEFSGFLLLEFWGQCTFSPPHLSLSLSQSNFLPVLFRFVVIDLSAGPCTYGKIETEEGSVSSKTLPRLRNVLFPRGFNAASVHSTHDTFVGQLAALVSTTVEHVIAPDVRYYFTYAFVLSL